LKQKSGADVYIDIGHPTWLGVDDAVSRLQQTGIEQANGFAINVSNFAPLDTNIAYGDQISSKLGGKHYIVDTSRNGAGSADGNWCNPSGKKLGVPSTFNTGHANIDAYLWIKHPGESDGTCNGGPSAGSFWADYLLRLF
jgi:endoglucanase